mgnify:CR=1 FL=1
MQYNRNLVYKSVRYALTAGLASMTAVSMQAGAQSDADEEAYQLERSVTTGSRLSRVDIEGASPVTVIDREDIARTGLSDLGDLLRELPSITGGPIGTQSNNPGSTSGATLVDIRGIGSQRTLVLVNGRRLVDGGDLANIPFSIIERVEILKQGAAAIYGADAVAGVVNIITRQDFSGAEFEAQYSQFTKLSDFEAPGFSVDTDDGANKRLSFTFGERGDKGGFVASLEYNDQQPIFQGETPSRALNAPFFLVDTTGNFEDDFFQIGSSFIPQGRFQADVNGDGVVNVTAPDPDNPLGVGNQLEALGFPFDPTVLNDNGTFRPFVGGGADNDTYNYAPVNFVQTPFERRSFFFQGDYDLFENVEAYVETRYTNRNTDRILAPLPFGPAAGDPASTLSGQAVLQPVFETDAEGDPIQDEDGNLNVIGTTTINAGPGISGDNAFNPFGVDVIDPRRRVVETGGRRFNGETNQFDLVTGLRGTLGEFAPTWTYDVNFNYGRRTVNGTQFGQFFGPALETALGPSFFDDNGVAVCGTPEDPIPRTDCVPLNLFGGPGTITQEMLDFVSVTASNRSTSVLQVFNAGTQGDLIELPAGPLALAVGYQARSESFDAFNDSGIQTGLVTGNSAGNTNGSFSVDSVYAETNIPLLASVPGAELLELSAGFRYDDYSTIGDTGNFQFSGRWLPFEGLLIRGSYAEVFREPGIGELFSPLAEGFPGAQDPCLTGGDISDLNCPGVVPGTIQDNSQVRALSGGNVNLDPETGETWTVGFAFSPEFLPGFSMTVDYWDLELNDAISGFSANTVLGECANNGNLCDLITRRLDGNIDALFTNSRNLGRITRSGIDFQFDYTLNTEFGLWDASVAGTFLDEATVIPFAGAPVVKQAGRVDDTAPENTGADSFPEWRLRGDINWTFGNFGASYVGTYIDSMDFTSTFGLETSVSSKYYSDVFVDYTLPTNTKVTFGVTNIFNSKAEIVDIGNANSLPETHRLSGRQVIVRLNHSF